MRTRQPAMILHGEPAPGHRGGRGLADLGQRRGAQSRLGRLWQGLRLLVGALHKEMVEIEVPYQRGDRSRRGEGRFKKRPDIKVVSLVHHDTPSGTINPANEIGKIVREHDALLIVDAVSSFGGMDIHPDDCYADIFITGPGKCLGGAPGLTLHGGQRPRLEAHEGEPEGARAPRC